MSHSTQKGHLGDALPSRSLVASTEGRSVETASKSVRRFSGPCQLPQSHPHEQCGWSKIAAQSVGDGAQHSQSWTVSTAPAISNRFVPKYNMRQKTDIVHTLIISPSHMLDAEMCAVITNVHMWCGLSISTGHECELCNNGWTDRDAVWRQIQVRTNELCISWVPDPPWEGHFRGWHVVAHCKVPQDGCIAHFCLPSTCGGRVLVHSCRDGVKTCKYNLDNGAAINDAALFQSTLDTCYLYHCPRKWPEVLYFTAEVSFFFFLSPQDLQDGSTDREPF